jgi:fatty acid desaturase
MPEEISLIDIQRKIRKPFGKEQVQQWMMPSEGRVWADLILDWSMIAAAFTFFVFFRTWWAGLLAFMMIGCAQYRLFILGHDGLHGNLSRDRTRNNFIARWLVYSPMFMGFADSQRNHLSHHQLLGTENDPDRYLHLLDNKNSRSKFLLFCSGLATFTRTVIKVSPFGRVSSKTKQQPEREATAGTLKDYVVERIPVMIWQAGILFIFLICGIWWAYPILWIAPIYFLVFLPDEIRAFCDHAVLSLAGKESEGGRLVTFTSNRLERIFLSPHNMNYHAEHHLWVGIPYYNLPKAHMAVKDIPEITVRSSYLAFLFNVVKNLPVKMSEDAKNN